MSRDLGLMVCESVEPELTTVVRREGWADVQVVPLHGGCLPGAAPRLHPVDLAVPALPPNLELHQIRCACAPPLAGPVQVHDHIAGHRIDNIFQLFLPRGVVMRHIDAGAYLVTSGWLSRWETHLADLGLSGVLAREMFQDFARSIVLVDTGIDPDAEAHCRAFSAHLQLPWTVIDAGLDLATLYLREVVHEVRAARQAREVEQLRFALTEVRANADLLFELQRELSGAHSEEEVIREIHTIFTTLFAPATLVVVSSVGAAVRRSYPEQPSALELGALRRFLGHPPGLQHALVDEDQGFQIGFCRGDTCTGGALLSGFLFPENRDEYLRQAQALAPVCELAIARARSLQGIVHVCSHCHQIRGARGDWRRFEEYLSSHSDALFSHSVCPACLLKHYPDLADDVLKDKPV